jgi:biopolymer transport protein ExbB
MVWSLFVKGGPVMWWLLGLSLVSVTVTIERSIFFWKESLRHKPREIQKILSYAEKNRLDEAMQAAARVKDDYIARTLYQGLAHREQALSRALETQAFNEMRRMKKYLTVLDTAITAAPLLGILGTVIGIIGSFEALGAGGLGDPLGVTKGISEALITTAFGLMIALGTLVPYNYFQSRFQSFVEELESSCSVLEFILQKCSAQACPRKPETSA